MGKDDIALDHVIRPTLPWRDDGLTECGRPVADVASAITRDAALAKIKEYGKQRAAMSTCMTCWTTTQHSREWSESPTEVMGRYCAGAGFWNPLKPETQLDKELRAIAALVAAHRGEFDDFLAGLEQAATLDEARAARARRQASQRWQRG